jgi:hypothetical protein
MCEPSPVNDHRTDDDLPTHPTRRVFLLSSLALLAAGCTSSATSMRSTRLPSPTWGDGTSIAVEPSKPEPRPQPSADDGMHPPGSLPRSAWTVARPNYADMNKQLPVRYITVHHDAQYSSITAQRDVAARLEDIRRYHRTNRGWADIGYHYAIDRAGRVWQTRPVTWQGAHVKDHNEANVGVMCLGNFDQQSASRAQLAALNTTVGWLMGHYNVPVARVMTHQEWSATACPGRTLQAHMVSARRRGRLG